MGCGRVKAAFIGYNKIAAHNLRSHAAGIYFIGINTLRKKIEGRIDDDKQEKYAEQGWPAVNGVLFFRFNAGIVGDEKVGGDIDNDYSGIPIKTPARDRQRFMG